MVDATASLASVAPFAGYLSARRRMRRFYGRVEIPAVFCTSRCNSVTAIFSSIPRGLEAYDVRWPGPQ